MSEFTGKRIVVTGGAGGIGVETARLFMEQGGHVIMVDQDPDRLAAAQERLGRVRLGVWTSALETPAACAAALDAAGGPVFAMIHLAGVYEPDALDADDHAVWNRAIAANLTNAYDMAVAFKTRFDRRDTARIVLASSIAYRRGIKHIVGGMCETAGCAGERHRARCDRNPHGRVGDRRTWRLSPGNPPETVRHAVGSGVRDPFPVLARFDLYHWADDHHRWRDYQRLTGAADIRPRAIRPARTQ